VTTTFPGGSETVFTYGAPALKFGAGASDEIGYDLSQYGARRVLVVTDPGIAATGLPERVAAQMKRFGVEAEVYDGVHVEPTDASMQDAIDYATEHGPWSTRP
jgi:hydroxyacid-oxoacid transhydrogenase